MLAIISVNDLIKVLATSTNQSKEKQKFLQRCDTTFCRVKKEICAVYVDFVDGINYHYQQSRALQTRAAMPWLELAMV